MKPPNCNKKKKERNKNGKFKMKEVQTSKNDVSLQSISSRGSTSALIVTVYEFLEWSVVNLFTLLIYINKQDGCVEEIGKIRNCYLSVICWQYSKSEVW